MSHLLECRNIEKEYTLGKTQLKALNGINLTIQAQDFLVLAGSSGSGKSTLLNLLGTIDQPTQGQILLQGQDIQKLSHIEIAKVRNEKIGFIFQNFNLIPVMNVLDNVMMPLHLRKMTTAEKTTRALQMLELVEMDRYKGHKPDQLSGGQRQRVAIARALVGEPQYVLADEPTASLDSRTAHIVIDLLKSLNKTLKTTFIISSHDEKLISRVEHIIRISDGKLQ